MIPGGSQIGIGTFALGSEAVRKGWGALSSLNDAIDGVKRAAGLSGEDSGDCYVPEGVARVPAQALRSTEVGQIYGRLKGRVKLVQSFDDEGRSMGTIRLASEKDEVFDGLNYRIRWRRRMGSVLVDIPEKDSGTLHHLTADDVGTIILIEIVPKEEPENTLNVTYAEVGPIEIDESTKTALSKSLKLGLVRFPVRILREELDSPMESRERRKADRENSHATKDILAVSSDDVKVIKNGMSCSNSNLDKKVEWSAKYFGGNMSVQLDHSSAQELTLCAGYDVHKQKIRIQTTSRNARDIAALTIRCLNIRHSVSLEAIIENGVSWMPGNPGKEASQGSEISENKKMSILAYIGRLEEEVGSLGNSRARLAEDKKRLQDEKAILENEIAETISAYQEIISQHQQERTAEASNDRKIKEFSQDPFPKGKAGAKGTGEREKPGLETENSVYRRNSSLIHGFSGNIHESFQKTARSDTNYRHPCEKTPQDAPEVKAILDENASLKLSNKELMSKLTEEMSAKKHAEAGAQSEKESMQMEMTKLRVLLEKSKNEREESLNLVEGLKREIESKDQELEELRSGRVLGAIEESAKVQELQNRIIELQGLNSEKQQAVQTLSTEKSKLSRDLLLSRQDSERLKLENNELNKKFVCLSLQSSKSRDRLKVSRESPISILPAAEDLQEFGAISKLKVELQELESANAELRNTITVLKSRVRKLAMVNSL
ncbi:putative coiled coil protein [Cryptosporidium felis]|nr:putative coiled coil protein [Cryptosporidium felis]